MFNLIRRISGSVHPRSDRPWNDDPTSNAPTLRKRRRSSSASENEDTKDERSRVKKLRSTQVEEQPLETPDATVTEDPLATIAEGKEKETAEVKEVTQGVKEVDLEEKTDPTPENVRLPSEEAGELDDPATSPPPSEKGDPAPAPKAEHGEQAVDATAIVKTDTKEETNTKGDAITRDNDSTTPNDADNTKHASAEVPASQDVADPQNKLQPADGEQSAPS